jgi:putative Mg2+ transporter-C (MgtC) family protein
MAISTIILEELSSGLPNNDELIRVCLRLVIAIILGGLIGLEREKNDKPAGIRTHMLVAMGSALFVLVPLELGIPLGEISRTVQGVATGIGFIGAGAIIKLTDAQEVQGLTTAAGIWLTAGVGIAVGLGSLGIALLAVIFSWLILAVMGQFQYRKEKK